MFNPITSRLPEKSDNAFLDSSGRLTTFGKPDSVICIQNEVVTVKFNSDLTAVISSSTAVPFPSKAELNRARTR